MSRALSFLLLVGLLVAGGIALLRQSEPVPSVAPPVAAPVVPRPLDPTPEVAAPPADTTVAASPEPGQAPRFDVVRVDPDGSAMVAGVADPGAEVSILVDDVVVGTVRADRTGAFAGFIDVPQGAAVRRLDLSARQGDGPERRSTEPVIVAGRSADEPDALPPVVALARADGVDLLQEPARNGADGVTVDLVSQGDGDALVVSGRGNVLRLVRLYANATFIAETFVREDGGWEIAVNAALEPGAHTLRADEVGIDGTVTSRVEVPFQRTDPDRVALGPGEMRVERGQTLWRIAESVYGSGLRFTVIYEANSDRIRDPDLIFPGQILAIPDVGSRP